MTSSDGSGIAVHLATRSFDYLGFYEGKASGKHFRMFQGWLSRNWDHIVKRQSVPDRVNPAPHLGDISA